jgi:hypothetical protein
MTELQFSARELELIKSALAERADSLTQYVSWVNDKPMLPSKEQAIGNVRAEVLETRKLALKIFSIENTQ